MIGSGGPLMKQGLANSSTVQGRKPESVRSMEDGCPNREYFDWVGKGELLRSAPRKPPAPGSDIHDHFWFFRAGGVTMAHGSGPIPTKTSV